MTYSNLLQRKLLIPLVMGFLAILPMNVQASHIIGGELTYRCLSNGEYEITLDVFRDCFYGNADFDSLARIGIFNELGLDEILSVMPSFTDTLSNDLDDPCVELPEDICVEWARYRDTVQLSPSATGHLFVYQRCCRNNTIINIPAPSNEWGATYFAELTPEGYNSCNSSPTFVDDDNLDDANYPPVAICVNKDINFDHSAVDADGDSLVYKLCTPYNGASINVPQPPIPSSPPFDTIIWQPPYNLNNLLGGSVNPLQIDSETGLLTGFPQIQGQFVVGVCVEEYRNGVLLSTVRRDFQYNVTTCTETEAAFIAPDAQCDDLTVFFENQSISSEDQIWLFEKDGQNFGVSTVESPIFTFSDTGSYTVTLITNPGLVCADTAVQTIFLQFNSIEADFAIQTFDCEDSSVVSIQNLTTDPFSPIVEWQWTITNSSGLTQTFSIENPDFIVPNPSSGTIEMTATTQNGCITTISKDFDTNGNNPLDLLPLDRTPCIGETISLNPNEAGAGFFTFNWGAPINSNSLNPMITALADGVFPVTITANNGLCFIETEISVNVVTLPELDFDFNSNCDGITVNFVNNSLNTNDYIWDFGDGSPSSTEVSPTHIYNETGTYQVTLQTGPNTQCSDEITIDVTLPEKELIADFEFEFTECQNDEVAIKFTNTSINSLNNTIQYDWQFENNGSSNLQNPTLVLTQEQTLDVSLTITTAEGCTSIATETLDVDFIEYILPDSVLSCHNEPIELNPNFNSDYTYLWTPATGLDNPTSPNPIANPQNTTIYTVFITNISADTCELSQQVKVVVPAPINLQITDDIETCDEEVTLIATSDLGGLDYSWVNDNTNLPVGNSSVLDVIVSGTTTYTVTARDSFLCEETASVTVTGGPIDIDLSGDQIKCTDEPIDISLTNLDPNDNLSITWSPINAFQTDPTNDPNPSLIITPGEQTIHVDVENQYGCTLSDSIHVALVDSNINLDFDFQVGCSGSSVTFTNLSTNAFNFVWDFGTGDTSTEENPVFTFPGVGIYTVTLGIGFDVDCVMEIQKEVEIVTPDFIPAFTYEYTACETDEIEICFTDTSINFLNNTNSWFWELSNGMTSNEQNPCFTINQDTDLTVTLTIGTPNNCSGSTMQTLIVDLIEEDLQNQITLCYGDTIGLNPNGDISYIYNWTPTATLDDPTAANPMAFPTENTVYSVEIINISADTCSINRTVEVIVPEKIEVEIIGETFTCGESIVLNAASNLDPAIDFEWFTLGGNSIGLGTQLSVNPLMTSTFILEGHDANGCFDRDTITVSNEDIDINISFKGESCPSDTLNLTAANNVSDHILNIVWEAIAPTEILGNNTGANVTILTAPVGTNSKIIVTSTNQFGCERVDTLTIFTHDFIPTVVDEVLACPDVETNINPGANPVLDYIWPSPFVTPNNAANPTVTINETMTFHVTVSQDFGTEVCTTVDSVLVNVPPIIDIEVEIDTFTCGEPITVCASTNVPVTGIQWLDLEGNILEGDECIEVNPIDEMIMIVQATDADNCMEADTVVVSNEQIDIAIEGDGMISVCPMDSFQICVENLDLTDFLTYEWSVDANGTISSSATSNCPWVTTIPNTTAIFTVTVTNQFGCTQTETITVQTYEFEDTTQDTIFVCAGIPTTINPNANFDLNYNWTPANNLDNPNSPNPIITTNLDVTLMVDIFGVNGTDTCFTTKTVQVIVNPLITLRTEPQDLVLCQFQEIALTAEADTDVIFTWSENPDFSNPIGDTDLINVNPMGTATYYVLAIDDLGCRDSTEVTINAFPLDYNLVDELNFCEETGAVEVGVVNNDPAQNLSFNWSPFENIVNGNSNGNPVEIITNEDVTVYVTIENQFQCTITDSVQINYFDLNSIVAEATATPDSIIANSGETSQLNVTDLPELIYEWSPSNSLDDAEIPNPIASPEETTLYTILITNEEGCSTEREIEVFVKEFPCEYPYIFVPTAFSPNDDGENDEFLVRSNIIEELTISIFNRWGQKVFETNDLNESWKGTFKNERLAPDVYGYYLTGKCFGGEEFFKKGNVTLIR